ncbi:hypothetical protein G6F35_013920 [Rhizopus arrhizus]|nr:hypothetical protein G6F35_013920 [Rhizopus arrhizus]
MMMPDYPIDAARRAELAAYRTALRDWPENTAFPNPGDRPAAPDWLADELGRPQAVTFPHGECRGTADRESKRGSGAARGGGKAPRSGFWLV